ncbi:MAG: Photosynthesis system assembly factor [Frankiaceae bacterium]|jgi:hypothetical protein|nr:Photosynthesis system assembly factor [Frankiaceae bacterium]
MRRTSSWRASIAVVSLVGVGLMAGIAPGAVAARSCVPSRSGQWQTAAAPAFAGWPAAQPVVQSTAIVAQAVDPGNASRVYVTNGYAVWTSPDGGCSWTSAYELPVAQSPRTITSLLVAGGGAHRVLALAQAQAEQPGTPLLLATTDSGKTWNESAAGIDVPIWKAYLAAGAGRTTYLSGSAEAGVTTFGAHASVLYRSADAGATWARVTSLDSIRSESPMWGDSGGAAGSNAMGTGLVVDPANASRILKWRNYGTAMLSKDGGVTWTTQAIVVENVGAYIEGAAFVPARAGTRAAIIVVYNGGLARSDDGGGHWYLVAPPATVALIGSAVRSASGVRGTELVVVGYTATPAGGKCSPMWVGAYSVTRGWRVLANARDACVAEHEYSTWAHHDPLLDVVPVPGEGAVAFVRANVVKGGAVAPALRVVRL